MREAKLLDEALDFGPASADAEKQPLVDDPTIDGSDSDTTTGGGVTSRRPLPRISTPVTRKTTETKCNKREVARVRHWLENKRGASASRK